MYSNNPCYTLYGYERFSFKYLVDSHINEMGICIACICTEVSSLTSLSYNRLNVSLFGCI